MLLLSLCQSVGRIRCENSRSTTALTYDGFCERNARRRSTIFCTTRTLYYVAVAYLL